MELSKKTFSGEDLQFLKSLSPKLKDLIGSSESKQIKAEDLFQSGKRGKTAAEKFYLFVALLFFDRQPIIVKGKFSKYEVRRNVATKKEIEEILDEAGIKNTKAIFQRAEKHYENSEGPKTATTAKAAKGKPEHSAEALREAAEERELKKHIERMRREQAERNRYHAEFIRESAAGWAKQFPGQPYPPRDPNLQWDHSEKKWKYYREPEPSPFYSNTYFNNNEPNVPGDGSYSERPSAPPPKASLSCEKLLAEKNITTYRSWLEWARDNHPDKGGDTVIFQNVSDCVDKVIKRKGGGRTRKRQTRRR